MMQDFKTIKKLMEKLLTERNDLNLCCETIFLKGLKNLSAGNL